MVFIALLIGLAGGFHCAGMCSPLVLAVTRLRGDVILSRLIYNAGRIFTYSMLGAAVASAGMLLPLQRFQLLLSILVGGSVLLAGLARIKLRIPLVSKMLQNFSFAMKTIFGKYARANNHGGVMVLGMLNGLLPCGVTYLALTYCVTLAGPTDGFKFMLLFGCGTLPVMMGLTASVDAIAKKYHLSTPRIIAGMLVVSGLLLISRAVIIGTQHASSVQEGLIDIVLCR